MGLFTKKTSTHFERDKKGRVVKVVKNGDVPDLYDLKMKSVDQLMREYSTNQLKSKPKPKQQVRTYPKMKPGDMLNILGIQPPPQAQKRGRCKAQKQVGKIVYRCGREAYHGGWCGNWQPVRIVK